MELKTEIENIRKAGNLDSLTVERVTALLEELQEYRHDAFIKYKYAHIGEKVYAFDTDIPGALFAVSADTIEDVKGEDGCYFYKLAGKKPGNKWWERGELAFSLSELRTVIENALRPQE